MDPEIAAQKIVNAIELPKIPEDRRIDLIEFADVSPDDEPGYDFLPFLQRAIDELAATGGGTLAVPHPLGPKAWMKSQVTYRLGGPLQLKTRVRLELAPSTRLAFDFNPIAFTDGGRGRLIRYEGTLIYGPAPCIGAFDASDLEIVAGTGSGQMPVIDGGGHAWQRWMIRGDFKPGMNDPQRSYMRLKHEVNNAGLPLDQRRCADPTRWFLRPDLFSPLFCRRIALRGVEFNNSPFWVLHPVFCTDLVFDGLKFECHNLNNDGIDPESCTRVLIERVVFNNADDNIAVKAGRDREAREGLPVAGTPMEAIDSPFIVDGRTRDHCSQIVARHNVFKGHHAVCIGSEVSGGASQIYVLDNTAPQGVRMLLNLKSSRSRGGVVEDVVVRGLTAHHVGDAAVCLIPNYDDDSTSPHPPTFRDVRIEDVQVHHADRGILIYGWPDAPTHDITLRNVVIDQVQSTPLEVVNAHDIVLEGVRVAGRSLDGRYRHRDEAATAPHQQ
jgi:polygalacturonase